jgi:hypothetical protein
MRQLAAITAALILASLAGGCASSDTSDSDSGANSASSSIKTQTTPKTVKGRVSQAVRQADASGYVGKLKLQRVATGDSAGTGALDIYLRTPEGGFSGASVDDLDTGAAAAFAAAYGKAKYHKAVGVIFRGGLVNSTTGKDLPKANTGIYLMTGGQAEQIDWSNDEALMNIDWSNYRVFAHPALKQ